MVETKPTHVEASNVHAILDTNNVDSVHLTLMDTRGRVLAIVIVCNTIATTSVYTDNWGVAK